MHVFLEEPEIDSRKACVAQYDAAWRSTFLPYTDVPGTSYRLLALTAK
jgi:hypothetical protein